MQSVTSRDGTRIAYDRTGSGPPLVFIHGGWTDHAAWSLVLPALTRQFTVYAVDRRGCGQSDPYRDDYAVERDFEDVVAVVDMIGEPVHLIGHSIGGFHALHGALLTPQVLRFVLYEPPLGGSEVSRAEVISRIESLIAAGDRDAAAVAFLYEIVGVPMAEIEQQRASPSWAARLDGIHAVPSGLRAFGRFQFEADRLRALAVPTLLVVGSESTPYHKATTRTVADALPNARIVVLPGQQHNANVTAPDLLAAEILRFLTAPDPVPERTYSEAS